MPALHGKGGNVLVVAATVAEIDEWSLDIDRTSHDITKFNLGSLPWKSFMVGLVGAKVKFQGRLDMTDTNGQVVLFNSLTTDSAIAMVLNLSATHNFGFNAFVEKFSAKAPLKDPETVSWDMVVTGAVTYT
jgi:hypothetical protein